MILLRFLLVLTFMHCFLAANNEKRVVSIVGKNAVLSCPWQWTFAEDLAVIVSINGQRVGFWKRGPYKVLSNKIVDERKLQMQPKAEAESFSLVMTVPNVQLADDNMVLKCEAFGQDGMGTSRGVYKSSLRVVDPPKIVTEFKTKQWRLRGSTESVEIECKASGNPKPTVSWSKAGGSKVKTTPIEGGVKLILSAPISDDLGGIYTCTAALTPEFAAAAGVENAKRELNFGVYYKPELIFEKKLIHTDLGTGETLKIEATGNPRPEVTCEVLTLPEPKLVRFSPQSANRIMYEVTLQSVRPQDVREYSCEAKNEVGVVKDTVKLTLAPSVPKILSKNSTEYSDYYELHWQVQSKAPVSNLTVEVHVKGKKNNSTPLRTEVFQLDKNRRQFRHHIANLTQDTAHVVRIKACNSRACSPGKAEAAFRTQAYNGGVNTVNPEILVAAITDAPTGAKVSDGSLANSMTPVWSAIFFCLAAALGLHCFGL